MLNHLLETLVPPDGPEIRLSGVRGAGGAAAARAPGRIRLENGRPIWRFEHRGVVLEKRIVRDLPPEHRPRLLPAAGGAGPGEAAAGAGRCPCAPHEGRVDQPTGSYAVKSVGDGVEVDGHRRAERPAAAAPAGAHRAGAPLVADERSAGRRLPGRAARAATTRRGELRTPGHFELTLAPGEPAQFTASTEPWEGLRDVDRRTGHPPGRRAASRACCRRRTRPLQHGLGAELVLAADQFIITPRVRPADEVAAARRGRRGAHHHRRLPLVHRLGPRHHDQPRGADAADRAARRGALASCTRSPSTCATA